MPDSLWSRLTWAPLSAAASRAGLSKRRLADLIEQNQIQVARRVTASGREFVMVRQKDIEAMISFAADNMCLAEAASCLGMKRQRLSRLLPFLCPNARKSTFHGTPWLIPKAWIEEWTGKLNALSHYKSIPSWAISLDQLLRYGPLDEHRVCTLLRDVEFDLFPPIGLYANSVGLAGLLFDRCQLLKNYAGAQRVFYSIPDAASRLGVKQEVAYALAALGLLEVEMNISGRRQAQGVSASSLRKFQSSYVLASDAAKTLGCSSRAIITALLADGIDPVAGPSQNNCRQTVYSRKDLERIPWLATLNGPGPEGVD